MSWFEANAARILDLLVQHLVLSVVPVALALVMAVPIGWWANRHPRIGAVLVAAGSLLYTVPSLALLILVPGLLGTSFLDPFNVGVVMAIYALALLLRVAVDAFAQISPTVLDAASATGYSAGQRFFAVELPLAGPVMLAGLRVVSVGTVSLVTVGALIGVSNLGTLFTEGFQRNFMTEVLIGIGLVVGLAMVLDLIWVALGRLLMPWARVQARSS